MYFNTVDFGNNAVGIKSAARTYFDKDPSEINTEEAAILVGMLKAPTQYSPRRHPQAALNRRNTVLGQMQKYGYLTKEQRDSLKSFPSTSASSNLKRTMLAWPPTSENIFVYTLKSGAETIPSPMVHVTTFIVTV